MKYLLKQLMFLLKFALVLCFYELSAAEKNLQSSVEPDHHVAKDAIDDFTDDFADDILEEPDPLEPMNRTFYWVNRLLDAIFLRPLSIMYAKLVPTPIKLGAENFIGNIFSPVSIVNHTLQGNGHGVAVTMWRFIINSTVGLFGVVDVAKMAGLPEQKATFNQTLIKWGFETGPYLMLPILGPSCFRDTYGSIGDWLFHPLTYISRNHKINKDKRRMYLALYGIDIVHKTSSLLDVIDHIEQTSVDPYISIRNIYFQRQKRLKQQMQQQ